MSTTTKGELIIKTILKSLEINCIVFLFFSDSIQYQENDIKT